jgi:hypothetical protein
MFVGGPRLFNRVALQLAPVGFRQLPTFTQSVTHRTYQTFTKINPLFAERHKRVRDLKLDFENKNTQVHLGKIFNQSLPTELFKDKPKPFSGAEEGFSLKEIQHYQQKQIDQLSSQSRRSKQEQRQLNSYLNSNRDAASAEKYIRKTFGGCGSQVSNGENGIGVLLPSKDRSLDQVYENSQQFVQRSQRFNEALTIALQEGGTPAEKALALERFLYEGVLKEENGKVLRGMERFNAQELKLIYMKFWDFDAHDLMVEMMEVCKNKEFTTNPIHLEFYARATLKGHYFNLSKAQAVANLLLEKYPDRPEGLAIQGTIHAIAKNAAHNLLMEIYRGKMTSDTIDFYQKCFPEADSFDQESVLENYYRSLSASIVFYEEAFSQSFDCRYGCRVMHRLLEQESPERARQMAELTILAAEKEGGLKSNNLSVVRSYLEALYVLGDKQKIALTEDVLLSLCTRESQISTTLGSLGDLAVQSQDKTHFIHVLQEQFKRFETQPAQAQKLIEQKKAKVKKSLSIWERTTFNYKGVNSNYIDGNFRFGARLPAHNINSYDQQFIKEILSTPLKVLLPDLEAAQGLNKTLQDITDFEEFNSLADAFIRQCFQTDQLQLERLDSKGHAIFDQSVKGILALSGAATPEVRKLIPNSRTNISTNVILGLGDCRHHAQVKQMLFDVWHTQRLNSILQNIKLASERGENDTLDVLNQEFATLKAHQLRTLDCQVYAPVEVNEKGYPVWHEGHLVKNTTGQPVKVEEHTLNMEIKFDETGRPTEGGLRDSFYQHTYPWQNCPLNLHTDLSQGVVASTIEVYNPQTQQLETCAIYIKPTDFAGAREVYDRGSNDNCLIGQPIPHFSFIEALNQRPAIQKHLGEVREWYQHVIEKTA